MPTPYQYLQRSGPFLGIDLQTSNLSKDPKRAFNLSNIMIGRSGDISKRPGTAVQYYRSGTVNKAIIHPLYSGGVYTYSSSFATLGVRYCFGLFPFSFIDRNNNRIDKFLSYIGSTTAGSAGGLFELAAQKMTITSTSTATSYKYTNEVVNGQWQFDIIENGVTNVFSLATGTPIALAAGTTISTLVSNIDALANYACTVANLSPQPTYASVALPTNPGPAAGLGPQLSQVKNPPIFDISYWALSPYDNSGGTPGNPRELTGLFLNSERTNPNRDFQITSIALNNILYLAIGGGISTGTGQPKYHGVFKYDGERAYPAGMDPLPFISSVANSGAGAVFTAGQVFRYACTFVKLDARNNETESDLIPLSSTFTVPAGGSAGINVLIDTSNIYSSTDLDRTSYPKSCRITAGVTSATIPIDNGSGGVHYFLPGDRVCFLNSAGTLIQDTVVTSTSTSVTFGTSYTVLANTAISLQWYVRIYRSKANGTDYFRVFDRPLPYPSAGTFTYLDNVADAATTIKYIFPTKQHGTIPAARLICAHQNCLILAKTDQRQISSTLYTNSTNTIPASRNRIYFSSEEHPEYFPPLNFIDLPVTNDEDITAIKSYNGTLYAFTQKRVFAIRGILNSGNFSVNPIEGSMGCVHQNTIQEIEGKLYYLGLENVYILQDGGTPVPIGNLIRNYLIDLKKAEKEPGIVSSLIRARASSAFLRRYRRYLVSLPVYDVTTTSNTITGKQNTTYTKVAALNIDTGEWEFWDNLRPVAFAEFKDDLWYSDVEEVDASSTDSNPNTSIRKFLLDDTTYQSYADNTSAISASWVAPWETVGNPGIAKQFTKLNVYSVDHRGPRDFTISLTMEKDFGYNTQSTTLSMPFSLVGASNTTSYIGETKPNIGKTKALRLTISNNTIYENISISGYEFEVAMYIQAIEGK